MAWLAENEKEKKRHAAAVAELTACIIKRKVDETANGKGEVDEGSSDAQNKN